MKINFNEKEYELHYSFRMSMIYEEIAGHSLDLANIKQSDVIYLFYAAFMSTLQYNKVENKLSYIDFLNWIDDNGGNVLLTKFATWYNDNLQKEADLMKKEFDVENKPKISKKETSKN